MPRVVVRVLGLLLPPCQICSASVCLVTHFIDEQERDGQIRPIMTQSLICLDGDRGGSEAARAQLVLEADGRHRVDLS